MPLIRLTIRTSELIYGEDPIIQSYLDASISNRAASPRVSSLNIILRVVRGKCSVNLLVEQGA